ncbi:MAG: YdeI/OmpD-associated family protein [Ferruginibacter sp.]
MALETILEKLQLKDEKNILVQGLPSSLEKQFLKLSFCKSVTPLLRSRKIDLALVFAISRKQLCEILTDVVPALHADAKLWVAYPKLSSKIASDLSRDENWCMMEERKFTSVRQIALDNVWTAMRFKGVEVDVKAMPKKELSPLINMDSRHVAVPEEVKVLFKKNRPAGVFFDSLSFSNKKEYVEWIEGAKKVDTKTRRLDAFMEKLTEGKKNPSAK